MSYFNDSCFFWGQQQQQQQQNPFPSQRFDWEEFKDTALPSFPKMNVQKS